ncbi:MULTISPECIES: hypothetical protein [unclassified Coleofasciculus]|uniref:hypothetical protein n=1 Tax=unclassified Coleofasciculus TaxID=2692782 RepID=UPI00188005B7|nr:MULTISPECIES: hypothetical protein [unclassified Coleofasciculus]MBE9125642.1 hypothetical protein [Coleofasciculus sp. LEGE 07081]MBE9148796.1 hypothetical protein [Coleofasciculus sp. LEGE 07092]
MLSQIVRPLVHTQIRLLANTRATRSTLIATIARWLGYLGVQAVVTHLSAESDEIQVSLTVGKPDSCDATDWQQIISHLQQDSSKTQNGLPTYLEITSQQRSKLQRLLAYIIQVGTPDNLVDWETLYPQLQALELDEPMILGIRAALKVPQSLDRLVEGIDPDLAAIALPFAVSIAWMDRRVNSHENRAISALFEAMK